ncbi:MAG: DNA repair protein RecN [Alphaproteobacteria bacterium]
MLATISIRDVVLIDRLDLSFGKGLSVLTGETGAGKSILLDALGLALGARADAKLVRAGCEQAVVAAEFDVPARHAARALLKDQGIDDDGGPIIVRRIVGADGRSRALVNGQPASVGLLRELGDLTVEIQGQFEQRGLLDPATHRDVLDRFGELDGLAEQTAAAWRAWRDAEAARVQAEADMARAQADEDFLRHALRELELLKPEPGEEARLQDERQVLMHREKLTDALNDALAQLNGAKPVADAVRAAQRQLERVAEKAGGKLDAALASLDRASIELNDAIGHLQSVGNSLDAESSRLQTVDDRLFGLRDLARKHRKKVDDLAAFRDDIATKLATLDDQGGLLQRLAKAAATARETYAQSAGELAKRRREAAAALDKQVARELPPLKLDKARFSTRIDALEEAQWGERGMDRVSFEVATNPGTPAGPLAKIASGGELSRFMLAIKVVLAKGSTIPTLVFDEVDAGVGGATAASVGDRLARLGKGVQVLVVTHSPQVAARGMAHYRVEKRSKGASTTTRVETLVDGERREEIARMLSGRDITDEARAQADKLMAGTAP